MDNQNTGSNIDALAQKIDEGKDLTIDELGLALAHGAEELEKRLSAEKEG